MKFPWSKKEETQEEEPKKGMSPLKAYYLSKDKYGRAPQARVANYLKTPGVFKRTNEAALYMDGLINGTIDFTEKLGTELTKIGKETEVESALKSVRQQLESQIEGVQKGGGDGNITITISIFVAKILLGIIKVILFSIALLFAIGLAVISEGSSNVGIPTSILSFDPFSKPTSVEEYKGGGRRRRCRKTRRRNKTISTL